MVPAISHDPDNRSGLLEQLFDTAVLSCQPRTVLPGLMPEDAPRGLNLVLGAGKASAEMAAVAHDYLAGPSRGLVVTRYGHAARTSTGKIEVVEAAHPIPDARSASAAEAMLELAGTATSDDRVFFLFSGGGSALLCAPIAGVSVEQKQEVTRFLLHSGAPIEEINLVRKHLSRIKGGGLAARAAKAELRTIVISDVVGDNAADVASGPSIAYERDPEGAIDILRKYGYENVDELADAVRSAAAPSAPDHSVTIAAAASTALDAVANLAASEGWIPVVIGEALQGDAAETGRAHAEIALRHKTAGDRVALISGGELTVKVVNKRGRGGPNLEYLTSLMIHLDGAPGIDAIACDSDGIDGSEDNAGGFVSSSSLARANAMQLEPAGLLAANDTYSLFSKLDDLIITGPTRTNVNDIRIILVGPAIHRSSD